MSTILNKFLRVYLQNFASYNSLRKNSTVYFKIKFDRLLKKYKNFTYLIQVFWIMRNKYRDKEKQKQNVHPPGSFRKRISAKNSVFGGDLRYTRTSRACVL